MYILGLSNTTDPAACLMRDGVVVAAASEAGFTRDRHATGFPHHAVEFVLSVEGLRPADVDHLVVSRDPYNVAHRMRHVAETLVLKPGTFTQKLRRAASVVGAVSARGEDGGWASTFSVAKKMRAHFGSTPAKTHYMDHHQSHMASCFYAAGWDDAALLVMDGAGEAACTSWGHGRAGGLDTIDEHRLPHSLGHFYAAVTGYLGFRMLGDECKVMELSALGEGTGTAWIRDNFLRSVAPGRYALETELLDFHRGLQGQFTGGFADHFGPARTGDDAPITDVHRDIAASTQRAYEQVVLDMAKALQRRTGLTKLGIAGGCGLNALTNELILSEGVFEDIYVPSAPNNAGTALGAAMLLYARLTGKRPDPLEHANLGPQFTRLELEVALCDMPELTFEHIESERALVERAATALCAGQLLAWFQGRMEFGPHALGGRSLLADPRSKAAAERLNASVAGRDTWRPCASSIKAERAADYFELGQVSPFTMHAVRARPDAAARLPAIVHADGTARPQAVEREHNPRYWALLDHFEAKTGIPVLLNERFGEPEPLVCRPAEALATFRASDVDALVLGDLWVTRRADASA